MTDHTPPTTQQLDDYEAAARNAARIGSGIDPSAVLELATEVRRLRARQLTASEYNSAWHAVEGAAGEEGADPGTVLHAVLDRLGIDWQEAARPAAAAVVPAVVETGEADA